MNLSTLGSPWSRLWSRFWLHLGLADGHHLLAGAVCPLPWTAGVTPAQALSRPAELGVEPLLVTPRDDPLPALALVAVTPLVARGPAATAAAAPAVVTTTPPGAPWPTLVTWAIISFARPSAPVSSSYPEPAISWARAWVARSFTVLLFLKKGTKIRRIELCVSVLLTGG